MRNDTSEGPLFELRRLRREGRLRTDPVQELAAEKLQTLHNQLVGYNPRRQEGGWMSLFARAHRAEAEAPQGIYIYGDVGRGKSMLMDLFFATAPVEAKRRVHFHAFMQEVHAEIHRWRQSDPREREGDDPIPPLAKRIAKAAWLLCFDEFQVNDVADAMILGRLFEKLFKRGVVVVATSNRHPDDLYKGGLNRPLFLPFIAMFKQKLDLLALEGDTDYRLARLKGQPVYHSPLDESAAARLEQAFADLTDGEAGLPATIAVQGRELRIARQARGVAFTSFRELCEAALGPADYLALAHRFHSLILSGIPRLGPEKRNEAKRFVTLIDALYEGKVKLVCSAAAEPGALYPEGDGAFEFQRTVSRLMEMQSAEYLALAHDPGD
ncbi:MAG: AFG1 family ATPase [Alphaproteobacteria bacterium]|nr:AFG1 family ATPase [Alphaproteobacteria bacterium]